MGGEEPATAEVRRELGAELKAAPWEMIDKGPDPGVPFLARSRQGGPRGHPPPALRGRQGARRDETPPETREADRDAPAGLATIVGPAGLATPQQGARGGAVQFAITDPS